MILEDITDKVVDPYPSWDAVHMKECPICKDKKEYYTFTVDFSGYDPDDLVAMCKQCGSKITAHINYTFYLVKEIK
jgi:hypothetical protein